MICPTFGRTTDVCFSSVAASPVLLNSGLVLPLQLRDNLTVIPIGRTHPSQEQKVEPWFPGLAAVCRGDSGFTSRRSTDRLPSASNLALCSVVVRSTPVNHFTSLHLTFDDQQPSSIGHPALSRYIIETETLTFQTVSALVVFSQNTAIKNVAHSNAC